MTTPDKPLTLEEIDKLEREFHSARNVREFRVQPELVLRLCAAARATPSPVATQEEYKPWRPSWADDVPPTQEPVKDYNDILRMVRELAADPERDHHVKQVAGSAENLINALRTETTVLARNLVSTHSDLDEARREIERLQKRVADLEANIGLKAKRRLREENDTLRSEVERLTRCCNGDVERERNELRAEVERLKETHVDKAAAWDKMIADKAPLRAQLAACREALDELAEAVPIAGCVGNISDDLVKKVRAALTDTGKRE